MNGIQERRFSNTSVLIPDFGSCILVTQDNIFVENKYLKHLGIIKYHVELSQMTKKIICIMLATFLKVQIISKMFNYEVNS